MKQITSNGAACLLFTLYSIFSYGQATQVAVKIGKAILRGGKETIEIFEKSANSNERLLLRIEDKETLQQMKKAHPGQRFSEIVLTNAEVSKILQKEWEKDHPAATAAKKEREAYQEDVFIRTGARERLKSASTGKAISPQNYFGNVETFISIPSSRDEYINIFKNENEAPLKNTIAIYNKVKTSGYNFPKSSDILIKSLSKKSNNPVTIIGHNSYGSLYFPDGSITTIKKIDEVAKTYNRIVVYLSCNAASYTSNPAVNDFLDYLQAIHLTSFIANEVAHFKKDITQKQAIENINALLTSYANTKALNYKLKVVAYVGIGGGAAYGLYQIKED